MPITRSQRKAQIKAIEEYIKNKELINMESSSISLNKRPRRNITRVDYTGMDTIEREGKYDFITDIWYDSSINYDEDYVYEEESDDEDYEVENECLEIKNNEEVKMENEEKKINELEGWFINYMKNRLLNQEHLLKIEDKMRNITEVMYVIDTYFEDILRKYPEKWYSFGKMVWNKAYEFECMTEYPGVEKERMRNFVSFMREIREKILKLFVELDLYKLLKAEILNRGALRFENPPYKA